MPSKRKGNKSPRKTVKKTKNVEEVVKKVLQDAESGSEDKVKLKEKAGSSKKNSSKTLGVKRGQTSGTVNPKDKKVVKSKELVDVSESSSDGDEPAPKSPSPPPDSAVDDSGIFTFIFHGFFVVIC